MICKGISLFSICFISYYLTIYASSHFIACFADAEFESSLKFVNMVLCQSLLGKVNVAESVLKYFIKDFFDTTVFVPILQSKLVEFVLTYISLIGNNQLLLRLVLM